MKTYIAILRGINVSGKHKLKMGELKSSLERQGFEQVETYIQSGNIVFQWPEANSFELQDQIHQLIRNDFGWSIPVLVFDVFQFRSFVQQNPFAGDLEKDPAFFHVTFFQSRPQMVDEVKIQSALEHGEDYVFKGELVYLYCPRGYGKTKLTNTFFENNLKVSATTRNWKTTLKLLEMAERTERVF